MAIDCEMVLTTIGSELARLSICNFNFDIVYDAFVKPKGVVTNYLTKYSGITKEILESKELKSLEEA